MPSGVVEGRYRQSAQPSLAAGTCAGLVLAWSADAKVLVRMCLINSRWRCRTEISVPIKARSWSAPTSRTLKVPPNNPVGQRAYDAVAKTAARSSALPTISPSQAPKCPRLRKRSKLESVSRPAASVISRRRVAGVDRSEETRAAARHLLRWRGSQRPVCLLIFKKHRNFHRD